MLDDKYSNMVTVLIDDLPDFDKNSAEKLCVLLENNGYHVQRVTAEEFKKLHNLADAAGFLLILPYSISMPLDLTSCLKEYATGGGQILTFGGPLFYNLIEKDDQGVYKKTGLGNLLDATFTGKAEPFVIEGVTPSYKTYPVKGIRRFKTEEAQMCFCGELSSSEPLDFICPCGYIHGTGYNNGRSSRFIPIVSAMCDENQDDFITTGRADGRQGAAAFFMLSGTKNVGRRGKPRIGTVENTVIGSAAASIGITRQDVFSVRGIDELILSVVKTMQRGLFLYEGGADGYRFKKGKDILFGAKVLNTTQRFRNIRLRFCIGKANRNPVFETVKEAFCAPRHITDVHFTLSANEIDAWNITEDVDLAVTTELIFEDKRIDVINQEVSFPSEKKPDRDEFVMVKGDQFYLNGKPWYPAGINYWPSYYPALEIADYWCGYFDKANYDPLTIEQDLEYIEKMGINCLFTRLDGYNHDRVKDAFADFLTRCEKHGMKLSLAYPNATSPAYYCSEAFQKLVNESGLAESTVLFCYDIAWEAGEDIMFPWIRDCLEDDWKSWITERYGSVENAQKDWGISAIQQDGKITVPGDEQIFGNDSGNHVIIAAFRRFLDDYMSKLWNTAIADMKKYDSNHLYTYRFGYYSPQNMAFSAAIKHIDFLCPEGYGITNNEDGYNMACFMSAYMKFLSGGKPIVWAEYGRSLCGTKWSGGLIWNHDEFSYYDAEIKKQTEYMRLFYRMMQKTGANGSAPWWWCGGFRLSEFTDFGYMGPEGLLRPCGVEYIDFIKNLKETKNRENPDTYLEVDRDLHTCGDYYICDAIGKNAWKEAEKQGLCLEVRTAATGTNSQNTPLIAIGNTRYNGNNPPKYLNSEFNRIFIYQKKREKMEIVKDAVVKVDRGMPVYIDISAGNLQEAEWLAPEKHEGAGGVYFASARESDLEFKIPIEKNTPYLMDATATGAKLCDGIEKETRVSICMEAEGKAKFGEIIRFTLAVQAI